MSFRSLPLIPALTSVLLATGCGGGSDPKETLVPVGGTLLVDGKPLDGVVVTFTPTEEKNSRGGAGKTDATGAFTVRHLAQNEPGLAPGKYTLRFSRMRLADGSAAPELPPGTPPDPANIQVETFPPELTNPSASSTQVEIPAAGNTKLELKISAKG
jgi:hypothetical protein